MISRADVRAAADRIGGQVRRTPVLAVDDLTTTALLLKCEYTQHTGTFKARGALNHILAAAARAELDPRVGIVVASGGNAGLANAWAATRLAVPATVFVPTTTPAVKLLRLAGYGATVVRHGSEYAEAYHAARRHAARTGAVYCHAYDQPEIVAGAGTAGLELLDQVDGALDTVVVAVGGGGLMAGIAVAVAGTARVVAVEPRSAPTLHAALAHGGPVDVAVGGIAADSLGARRLGDIAYQASVRHRVRSVLVGDDDIVAARRLLWEQTRIVVEYGAAAALAALTGGGYRPQAGERVAVLLCGANTDPSDLAGAAP